MIDINTPDTGKCFYAALFGVTGEDENGYLRHEKQISHIFEADIGAYNESNNCVVIPTYDTSIVLNKMWDNVNSTWDNPTLIDTPFRYIAKVNTDVINVGDRNSDKKLTEMLADLEAVKGSYTGNGEATRTIELGFTPSAVFVCKNDGVSFDGKTIYGGLAVTGSPAKSPVGLEAVAVAENGFTAARAAGVNTNMSLTTYNYVAVK